jgi:hypothetical protein
VTQKGAGSHSCFLLDPAHPGPPNHACASPVTLQILFIDRDCRQFYQARFRIRISV